MARTWMLRGLSLVGSVAISACTGAAANSPVAETAPSDQQTQDLHAHHRHHHRGGVTMFVAMSLDTLGLPPEQEAVVAKIQDDLFARMEPTRLGERAVLDTLADGIAVGAVDRVKLDTAITQLAGASGAVHDATAEALNQLHAALTPAQRGALVDKVLAHWNVSRQGEDEGAGKGRHDAHLAELGAAFGLSADQSARISASFRAGLPAVPAPDVGAHLQRLDAFRGEVFDVRTLPGGAGANAELARRGALRMARFYEAVATVLTPEQRAKLARTLREHAGHEDGAVTTAP